MSAEPRKHSSNSSNSQGTPQRHHQRAADQHAVAAEQHAHAAAKLEAGEHEAAAHHAVLAMAHAAQARDASLTACKSYAAMQEGKVEI